MKINSPIRYFGGKGTMFNNIIEHFPTPETYNTYIEPFGGSYTIGIKAGNDYYLPPNEIYNDLEKNVYSLFKVLSEEDLYEQFKHKCDLVYYNEDIRNEFRHKLRYEELDLVDRAFMFFFVNRSSHNGIGGFSTNLTVRRNMSKSVSDMLSAIDRMDELHQRISRLIVLNQDGIKLINKYNTDNCFLYCDPPYEQSTRTNARYAVDMDSDKHDEFIDACINSNAKILISGYDCEKYDKLIDNGFHKIQFEVNTISGKMEPKTKVETLWKNY